MSDDMEQERRYEEAMAELSGKTSIQRDAMLLGEVRKINGNVKRHAAILFGNADDPGDNGIVYLVRENTRFRENTVIGSQAVRKVAQLLVPPAVLGGVIAFIRAVVDGINLLNGVR